MSLKSTLGNIELDSCVYNASGCYCTENAELIELDESDACAIISKSCTLNFRIGNDHPRYYENEHGSINSTGLANNGYKFYRDIDQFLNKPYIISISSMDMNNLVHMLDDCSEYFSFCTKQKMVEINVSCPNVVGMKQLAYDPVQLKTLLDYIQPFTNKLQIGLKLPPYFDPSNLKEIANVLMLYNIKFITCSNSLGNGIILDPVTLKPSIIPKNGLGGIGGDYCKPSCLANVYQFYKLLDGKIDIVGCGGIKSGQDVIEYIAAGATAVQIGTHLMKNGTKCFEIINNEIREILYNKNIDDIMKLKGISHTD